MIFKKLSATVFLFGLTVGINAGNGTSCCTYTPITEVRTIYYAPSQQYRSLRNAINEQGSSRASVASSEDSSLNPLGIQRMDDRFQFIQRNLEVHREIRTQEVRALLAARARDNQRFRQIVEELERAGQPIDTNAIDWQIQQENAVNR